MDTNECSLCRPGGFALTRQMFQFAGIEIPEAGAAEDRSLQTLQCRFASSTSAAEPAARCDGFLSISQTGRFPAWIRIRMCMNLAG